MKERFLNISTYCTFRSRLRLTNDVCYLTCRHGENREGEWEIKIIRRGNSRRTNPYAFREMPQLQ